MWQQLAGIDMIDIDLLKVSAGLNKSRVKTGYSLHILHNVYKHSASQAG